MRGNIPVCVRKFVTGALRDTEWEADAENMGDTSHRGGGLEVYSELLKRSHRESWIDILI